MIQWYPGHMAKTKRMLEDNLKLIDMVIEIIDARIPASSKNPDFDQMFSKKSRLLLMNKTDLADNEMTKKWVSFYTSMGISTRAVSSMDSKDRNSIINLINDSAAPLVEKMKKKGVNKTVRVLIAGIPNVGKSTLINRLAGKNYAKVGNKQGVTRGKQWIRLNQFLEVMDSPGLLWPRLDNEICARHLACVGSINDDIIEKESLSVILLKELFEINQEPILIRYPSYNPESEDVLSLICKDRNLKLNNGEPDYDRASNLILDEYRSGKLGKATLEDPNKADVYHEDN